MKAFPVFLFVSLLVAISRAAETGDVADGKIEPQLIIGNVVKNVLATLKKTLADFQVPDLNQNYSYSAFNVTLNATENNLDKAHEFENPNIATSLIPLRINNLTLTWKEVGFSTNYDVNGSVDIQQLFAVTQIFGKGKGSVTLSDVFFTIGVKLQLSGLSVEIQNKGLFNFDLSVGKAKVNLESLLGSKEIGFVVGTLMGEAIPNLINALKNPLFDLFHDQIVQFLNSMMTAKSYEEIDTLWQYFDRIEANRNYH